MTEPRAKGVSATPSPEGETSPDDSDLERSRDFARSAGIRSGVEIRQTRSMAENEAMSALLQEVWGVGPANAQLNPGLIRLAAHLGCYVAVAFDDDDMVAAAFGLFAADGHLHSHIAGVHPSCQGRGVGLAIKLHQRLWALERGIDRISWTFDPLVARNAYFNITRLGVDVVAYHREFYGEMRDAINAGDSTDRLFVDWNLSSDRVDEAVSRSGPILDVPGVRSRPSTVVAVDVDGDQPIVRDTSAGAEVILVGVPSDIETIRLDDQDLARDWRVAVRAGLGDALNRGYRVTGMSRDGWYLLEKP